MTLIPRIAAMVTPLALVALAVGCDQNECTRSSDCPAGRYCSDHRCVPFEDGTSGPDADADADVEQPDVGPDADAGETSSPDGITGCTSAACGAFCTSVGQPPGECVGNECFCRGGGTDVGADGDADGGDSDGPIDGEFDEGWLCREDWECDDFNPCTADHCSYVSRSCVNIPLPEGSECSDGEFCNGLETCRSGSCVAGSAPCISTSPECSTQRCDEGSDTCVAENQPDGTPCETGFFCRGPGACQSGVCLHSGPYPCPPVSPEPCSAIMCNEGSRSCDTVPKPDGASCDDGVVCNGTESCRSGTCVAGAPFCDDGNACTNDICVEDPIEPTCTHTPIPGC